MKPVALLAIDPATYPDGFVANVRGRLADREIIVTTNRDEIVGLADRTEIGLNRIPFDLLGSMPNLKWFQQAAAGADWIHRHPEVRDLAFALTSTSGIHAVPMSEHLMAFLLAFARGFPASIHGQKRRVWEENRNQDLFVLPGKRVLILGVGEIGARFAMLCKANEMDVVGIRRNPGSPLPFVDELYGMDRLQDELPRADVVANVLPFTSETSGLLGSREFALMRKGSIFLNVGRGKTVDEPALIAALKTGHLRGAGLDVFAKEPLEDDSPLWDMKNVIVTPHYSGLFPNYNHEVARIFLDNLGRYLRGDALLNVVDKTIGY